MESFSDAVVAAADIPGGYPGPVVADHGRTGQVGRDRGDRARFGRRQHVGERILGAGRYSGAAAPALHVVFKFPEGVQPGQERNIQVDLSPEARRRFSDAEVRYRRAYMSPNGDRENAPVKVTRAPSDSGYSPSSSSASDAANSNATPTHHRRVAVNEDGSAVTSQDQQ